MTIEERKKEILERVEKCNPLHISFCDQWLITGHYNEYVFIPEAINEIRKSNDYTVRSGVNHGVVDYHITKLSKEN